MALQRGPGLAPGPEPLYSATSRWRQAAPGSKMGGNFLQPGVRCGGKLSCKLPQWPLHPVIPQFYLTPASPQPSLWPPAPDPLAHAGQGVPTARFVRGQFSQIAWLSQGH